MLGRGWGGWGGWGDGVVSHILPKYIDIYIYIEVLYTYSRNFFSNSMVFHFPKMHCFSPVKHRPPSRHVDILVIAVQRMDKNGTKSLNGMIDGRRRRRRRDGMDRKKGGVAKRSLPAGSTLRSDSVAPQLFIFVVSWV